MTNKVCYILLWFMSAFLFFLPSVTYAHQPHDVIAALAISPVYGFDGTLFAVVESHSIMKSTNGGYSWGNLEKGLDFKHDLSSISISPNFYLDKTLFLSSKGDGIYKSEDGGNSWFKVNEGLSSQDIELIICSPDFDVDEIVLAVGTEGGIDKTKNGGQNWYSVLDGSIRITALAFSPDYTNDSSVFAGDDSGNLYYSPDQGESWIQTYRNLTTDPITSIATSPEIVFDHTIFVSTYGDGIYKSVDKGRSFFPVNEGISDDFITSLAISPEYGIDSTIFACGADEAVFQSNDGGASWKKHSRGIYYRKQGGVHYRYLKISKTFAEDRTIFLGAFEGLFKSRDGGHTWLEMETFSARTVTGIAISPEYSIDSEIFISTYGGGAYKSIDKGGTWTVNNRGLERPFLYDIIFSPAYLSDNTMFTLQYDYVAKSINGGETWDINKISSEREVFPTVIVVSTQSVSNETLFLGSRYDGCFKSIDGGINWFPVFEDVKWIESVVISPYFSVDGTVYVGTSDEGIFKTTDGGAAWLPMNNGLTSLKRIKLAISPNYHLDNTVFAGTAEGLFKSTNGGENWEKLATNPHIENGLILGQAISPNYENDKEVIVAVHGFGLFKTHDGGLNWISIGTDLIDSGHSLRIMKFSPSYVSDKTIYGATSTELLVSADGGHNWDIIKRPVGYENTSDFVRYQGEWKIWKNEHYTRTQSMTYSKIAKNRAFFSFVGTGISWIGSKSSMQGIAKVYIDGVFDDYVDLFTATTKFIQTVYSKTLSYGPHSIVVEVTDSKNPGSSDYYVAIDAFDVTQ